MYPKSTNPRDNTRPVRRYELAPGAWLPECGLCSGPHRSGVDVVADIDGETVWRTVCLPCAGRRFGAEVVAALPLEDTFGLRREAATNA